ncbi:MAG: GNAT family N-acetyltransferase [Deltaproteobacteria bacterium]|nr:MAG: GNAT family N-acetyltransferase [Deltaproteobacteria bacterium]
MPERNAVRIREFKRWDIHAILEIEAQAFPKTAYSKGTFLRYARAFHDGFLILETNEDIAGYIIVDPDGHIHSTAVKPAFRRKGFGTKLFTRAVAGAQKNPWLEVRSRNSVAIAFYKAMGMNLLGKIPGYYGDDDALILVLDQEKGDHEI